MSGTLSSPRVSYRVDGPLFIIQLDEPETLNSLTFDDFVYIATLLEKSNDLPETHFTVIQSSGKFFSAGGKFTSVLELAPGQKPKDNVENDTQLRTLYKLIGSVAAPNVYVTNAFVKHNKPIVCLLNRPAIGLAACLVCLSDIVYSRDDQVYLLFPFSSLGFVAEVGSSVTLYDKLGVNATNEHLFFSTKIPYEELAGKIVVHNYAMSDTTEFNSRAAADLKKKCAHLSLPSLREMKKVLAHETRSKLRAAQALETNATLPFWIQGEPFKRFQDLQQKKRRHKL